MFFGLLDLNLLNEVSEIRSNIYGKYYAKPMRLDQQRYEEVLNTLGIALICENIQGQVVSANAAAYQILQLSTENISQQLNVLLKTAIDENGHPFPEAMTTSWKAFQLASKVDQPTLGLLLPGSSERLWFELHILSSNDGSNPSSHFTLIAFHDIGTAVMARQAAANQQALQSLLLRITQTYISIPIHELDSNINQSLHELGDFIGADRIYVFDYLHDQQICKNTYEWCAPGIEPQIEDLQSTPFAFFPDWLEAHLAGRTMLVQDVSKLDKAGELYQILEPQGIQSLIAVPMMDGAKCIGFVGIDAVRTLHTFTDAEQQLLQIFSQALVNVKKRFAAELKVIQSEQRYRQMAENLTEVLWTSDVDFNVAYVSPSLAQFLTSLQHFDRNVLQQQFVLEQDTTAAATLEKLSEQAKNKIFSDFSVDAQWFTSPGNYRWVHLSIKPNFDGLGNFQGFLGVIRDIHERKQAEILLLDVQDQTIERFKELRCIYETTKLSQTEGLSLPSFIQQIVDWLPPAFHYPSKTSSSIRFLDDQYCSENYFESECLLVEDITLKGERLGEISVFVWDGDFLKEEVDLLKALSVLISRFYEKQLNQKELQISEEKYRIIADNTFNWEFWVSPEFKCIYHSPACERISGLTPQQLMDDTSLFMNLIEPDDQFAYEEHLARLMAGKESGTFCFKMRHQQGDLKYVELVGQRVFGSNGELLGLRGSHTDVTSRKLAEQELEVNQEKLGKMLATQTFYVIRTDLNGLHTYWNEKFAADFGWIYQSKGMELSDSLASICEYDREKASSAAIECLSFPGKIVKVELDKPLRNKQIATTLWEFVALVDGNGQPNGVQCMGLDITERRLVEKELRANAEYLTKLMATQTNYVIRTNLEGLHTYWNSKFEEDFGWMYKKRGMDQSDSLASICEYDRVKAEKAAMECLSTPGTIVKVELDKPSKDGGVMSTLWEFVALVGEDGIPVGVQCMGLDITERKHAEFALKKSEEQYRGLIESSDAAISMLDPQGNYLYMNSIAARPYGLNAEEAVGKTVHDFFSPADSASILRDINQVIERNEGMVLEPFLVIEGKKRWFRTSIQPIRDENGQPNAVFMHATEITAQKESEMLLKASEEKYKTLFYDSPDAYLMLADGVFIDCNRATELLIGMNRQEIIGKSPAAISPKFQPNGRLSSEYAVELLEQSSSAGKVSFEWEHVKANGQSFLAQVNLAIIEYENRQVHFISWQDITKQKAAQEEIKRFSQTIEQSPFSVVMTDLNGKLVYANAFAAKASGYSQQEILGVGFENFYPEYTIEVTFKEILEHLQNGKEWRGVLQGRKSDGAMRWESAIFFPVTDEAGIVKNYIAILEDITEKLAVEEALSLSERRSAEIAEHSRTVIWEVDVDGLYTYVSPVAEKVYLRKPEDLVGKTHYFDLHPETGRSDLIASFEAAKAARATILDYENVIELPDKRLIWVSTNGTPYFDVQGNLLGYRGSDKDITAKKLSDEEVRKFRVISDQANYGTAIASLDGILQYVNKSYAQMHGYEPEELVGTSVVLLHDTKDLEHEHALFDEIKKERGFAAKEVQRLRKDGSTFPALMSSAIIGDPNSEDSFLSATIIDIAERKEMEHALIELNTTLETRIEERTQALKWSNEELVNEIANRKRFEAELQLKSSELQTFFDVALDLMCIADLNGNFVKLNKAWVDLLGYSMQELLSRKFLEFVHPDDLEETLAVMGRLKDQETVVSFTNRYSTAKGDYRFIEWHSVPVGDLIYAAARDITERIQQTEALTLARRIADEANQSKSEFLSRMSHELRTPLNSILGFAQLLAMGQLAESQQKGVNHILRSGRHLLDLINEVLDISRIEAGRISVSVEPVNVSQVMVETVDLLSPYAQTRQIQMHLPPQLDKKLMVLADQQRLKQVITNIVNNALKYNKDGGEVWLDAVLMPAASNGAQFVRISVKDSGQGIAASDLDRIFNPFERLSAIESQTEGTGLGLTVVKQLLDLMGGTVKVESEPGQGSTFEVYLPFIKSHYDKHLHKLEIQPSASESSSACSTTILYVEDNNSNLELVEQIVSMSQDNIHLVHTAYGGMAVAKAKECKPSLILLDLNLPDSHGSQVIQWLKNDEVTQHIPVIVVSADAMPDQVKELTRLGAVNYLTKPLEVQVFLTEIRKYLR